jgi:hypothetical protein
MKTTIFLIITMFLGVSFISSAPNNKGTTIIAKIQNWIQNTPEPRIDFILGSWTGTGFITDANGLEQYIEIKENNSSTSNNEYQIAGVCKNPGSNFVYVYNKPIYFNKALNGWYTKGTIDGNILPDSRTTLGEEYALAYTYSYYDSSSILVRHTTVRDSEDSFTETKEKMGKNGWDKTAWFRMTRIPNK